MNCFCIWGCFSSCSSPYIIYLSAISSFVSSSIFLPCILLLISANVIILSSFIFLLYFTSYISPSSSITALSVYCFIPCLFSV